MRKPRTTKNKHLEAFRAASKEASDRLATAHAFLDDGALLTAARFFREAADQMEKAQAARNAWVEAGLGRG